jgi:hypothetical protein
MWMLRTDYIQVMLRFSRGFIAPDYLNITSRISHFSMHITCPIHLFLYDATILIFGEE